MDEVSERPAAVGRAAGVGTKSPSAEVCGGREWVTREYPASRPPRHSELVSGESSRATCVRGHLGVVSDEVSERPAAVGRAAGVGTKSPSAEVCGVREWVTERVPGLPATET